MLRNALRGKPIGALRLRSSADYGLREEWRASRVLDGVCPGGACGAFAPSALSVGIEMLLALRTFWTAVVVPFGAAAAFLYLSIVNVLLMDWWVVGCYR